MFTVPLKDASSYKLIKEVELNEKLYLTWKEKFAKTILQAYGKAPYLKDSFDLIRSVLDGEHDSIGTLAKDSIQKVCAYLDVNSEFVPSSAIYNNKHLSGQERVIDICLKEEATTYVNAKGGMSLYSKTDFAEKGLELKFVSSNNIVYSQQCDGFLPWLSIIDVMMFNSPEVIKQFLGDCSYV